MTFSDINLKFTLTNVCFGQETFADNEIMIYDLTNLGEPRPKVERYVLWTRWKRAQWCVLSVIKPKELRNQVASMEKIAAQTKANKEQICQQIHQLKQRTDQLIIDITNTQMTATQVEDAYNELVSFIDREFRRLKPALSEQGMKNEQERLKRIENAIENEKHKKINEDKHCEQEKEEFQQRSIIPQRQREELAEEAMSAEMNERKHRGYDLARRLALEKDGEADLPHVQRVRRPVMNLKYDLRMHTYAQLRDLLNESSDLELLDTCREEFHRRLKIYHAWKAKNRKGTNPSVNDKSDDLDEERAPEDILNNGKLLSIFTEIMLA
ncbi:unnamed protein product [Rotaria magnacalcarata]|uniref:Uncharacterized protein n=1 Tax=Rotaria magnacalcarata TaxID=392030 RepID=A0A816ZC50_9BILA|nr:unnamed protein product [Rotaria magnacalcarata]CAF2202695.1 unnamed protein product [Rotaria magnacalcarata]